mmetsp:Transcript_20056/g.45433  ORF Transcript_20056/g.45433 Transcript_20056/m.45433 type:complete len:232 (+) Transcript_20056:180-875(+)
MHRLARWRWRGRRGRERREGRRRGGRGRRGRERLDGRGRRRGGRGRGGRQRLDGRRRGGSNGLTFAQLGEAGGAAEARGRICQPGIAVSGDVGAHALHSLVAPVLHALGVPSLSSGHVRERRAAKAMGRPLAKAAGKSRDTVTRADEAADLPTRPLGVEPSRAGAVVRGDGARLEALVRVDVEAARVVSRGLVAIAGEDVARVVGVRRVDLVDEAPGVALRLAVCSCSSGS